MNEPVSLVLDDLPDCRVIMANIDMSSVGLEIQVAVALMIKEVLHVSLSDNKRSFVIGGISYGDMFVAFGDDFFSIAYERLGSIFGGRQGKGREKSENPL